MNIDGRINKFFLEINDIKNIKKITKIKFFLYLSIKTLEKIEQRISDNKNSMEYDFISRKLNK
jgi:hypothetical protein